MSSDLTYCEMCGRPMKKKEAKVVYVEGSKLVLCSSCYSKVSKRAVSAELREITRKPVPTSPSKPSLTNQPASKTPQKSSKVVDEYEVVPDYYERVRKAREKLGWSQKVLANVVKESENVIKRIEAGRLVPSIDLARKLENVLKIQLLEPVVDTNVNTLKTSSKGSSGLTIGDVMVLRKEEKNN
ncbi:MAG: multiprotein bridging factor aMBF1 [Thermoprotei archaeon]